MNIKEAIEYVKYQIETGNLIKGYTDIYLFADEVKVVLAELEKKDKVINKMAERLTTDIHSKEWVINYYEREVEKC